jgi:hypothetical protein
MVLAPVFGALRRLVLEALGGQPIQGDVRVAPRERQKG